MIGINRTAFKTILRREIMRIVRIWPQTLIPPTITMSLYFLIFGAFIGSQIGDIKGVPYISFILPGLIMMSVISNAYLNVVSSLFGSKFQRNIEEMIISPMSTLTLMLGFVAGGVFRSIVVGTLVTIVGLFFTDIQVHNWWILCTVIVLTACLFALGGIINALFAKTFDDISIIPTFVITPLTYLGGVFYSVDLLPPFWRQVSLFNPILYLINTFRYGFIGVSDINIRYALVTILVFIILIFSIAYYLLHRGVGIKE